VGLGILDLERDLLQHQLFHVRKRDVTACFGIVKPAIGVFLDDPGLLRHERSALPGCDIISPATQDCKAKGLKNIGKWECRGHDALHHGALARHPG
jgi:hypothetical protein